MDTSDSARREREERRARYRDLSEEIWNDSRRGRIPLTPEQKDAMNAAYWLGVLPKKRDTDGYCLYQWVEDNCPVIV